MAEVRRQKTMSAKVAFCENGRREVQTKKRELQRKREMVAKRERERGRKRKREKEKKKGKEKRGQR